nr:PREDICTED: uncharacterized protein LOC105676441 isoform X2 [Linepithema humile]
MSAPTRWCSAPGCMTNIKITKRHFFKFPKDRERWLEWIKACNRMDLEKIGPEYTNLYYRLCHLHFRIDLFKNIEGKIFLNREAVPSIFLKSIQAENVKSGDLVQPLSFVTIFLKPESRSKNSSIDLSTLVQSEPSLNKKMPFLNKSDEKNTLTIPTLKVLFPRTSIKQTLENRKYHVTVLERKSENDNGNTSTTKIQLVKDVHANSAASIISSQLKKEFNDKNIIDLTISDSLMSTMSSTHSTPQHSNRDIVGLTNSDSLLSTTLSTIVPLTHSTPQHSNRNSLDLTNSNSVLPTTSSTIVVPSTHSTPQHDNRNILDLNSDSSLSTTSSTIVPSTHSTPQHGNRTSKRKHWHISTQTPEAWLYIDSFLKKKQMEKCETCAVSLATKRRKVLNTEEADQHLNVEQVKTACANLLPRASALLFSACIDAQKMRKNGKNFDRQFALRLFFAAPIAYRSYRMLRLLPTVRQLRRHIRSWDMPPGLNAIY